MNKESQKLVDQIESIWADAHKNVRYTLHLGRYVITYNPYDDKEVKEVNQLAAAYYDGFTKGGKDLAEKQLLKKAKHEE